MAISTSEISISKAAPLNLHTVIAVSIFHILAFSALFFFSWENLASAVILWWISGSWGIGIGYHRLLTHRGFKAPKFVEYFLSVCGTLALQSGPLAWVTTHRIHHAFTETDNDPHSPRHGTYWAHIGWIFRGVAQNQTQATIRRYCPDLADDRFLQILNRYYYVPTIVIGIALAAFGGPGMLLWAIFFRVVFGWHSTWLVNSATHLWGSRRFETRDDSRNNGLIAAITFGEGWHNNHHAYPRSARHGLAWYQIDPNWIQIRLMEKVGLISAVYAYKDNRDKEKTKAVEPAPLEPIHETA